MASLMLMIVTIAVAGFFLLMGIIALATPERISAVQGVTLTPDGRNEVRAVYGGFGVVIAAVLVAVLSFPAHRVGVFLTVAAALSGMALGRLVAAAIELPRRFYPSWFYCVLELAMAASLSAAAFLPG